MAFDKESFDYLPQTNDPHSAGGFTIHCLRQNIKRAAMTDPGAALGTILLDEKLPLGAIPLAWKAIVKTPFTGNASAVLMVGIAADTDRFSADIAQSVFTAGVVGSQVIPADAQKGMAADQVVQVTITGSTDFTLITAGDMDILLYYIRTSI